MRLENDKLIEKHDLNLGVYYFFAEIKEGKIITSEKLDDLIPLVIKHYGSGKPFSYISNRINFHSISPVDYLDYPLNSMKNCAGYRVVTYNKVSKKPVYL